MSCVVWGDKKNPLPEKAAGLYLSELYFTYSLLSHCFPTVTSTACHTETTTHLSHVAALSKIHDVLESIYHCCFYTVLRSTS